PIVEYPPHTSGRGPRRSARCTLHPDPLHQAAPGKLADVTASGSDSPTAASRPSSPLEPTNTPRPRDFVWPVTLRSVGGADARWITGHVAAAAPSWIGGETH